MKRMSECYGSNVFTRHPFIYLFLKTNIAWLPRENEFQVLNKRFQNRH